MVYILTLLFLPSIVIFIGLNVLSDIYLTFILFYGVVCILIPLFDWRFKSKILFKNYLTEAGFIFFKKSLLPGIIVGLLFFIIICSFFYFFHEYLIYPDQTKIILRKWNFNLDHLYLLLFIIIFVNSILEEIYWRGFMILKLSYLKHRLFLVFVTAFFYALYHLITTTKLFDVSSGILFTVVVFSVGLFWGYIRLKYKSLYPSILSHLLADLGIMVVYLKYGSI
jgi:membrane protease YdiL (CAAX protease family)